MNVESIIVCYLSMNIKQLFENIKSKKSFLCVGLDPDLDKIPKHLLETQDPIFEFNKAIIDATLPYAIAYKPNIAFYESLGIHGWQALKKTVDYIPQGIFTIADAKRGDIGNTSNKYAEAFFKTKFLKGRHTRRIKKLDAWCRYRLRR